MRTLSTLVLALLFTPTTAFARHLSFDPPRPAPDTAVTLKIRSVWRETCLPRNPRVVRSNDLIIVEFSTQPPNVGCGQAITPWNADVPLGFLPAGGYTVDVQVIENDGRVTEVGEETLVVFQQTNLRAAPVTIPTTGGTVIAIGLDSSVCTGGLCNDLVFAIDHVQLEAASQICCIFGYAVEAPPHAPGPATLTIRDRASNTLLASAILRYYDPADTSNATVFEPVLIPLIFSGPGALGARWTTDASLLNRNNYDIRVAGRDIERLSTVDLSGEERPAGWVLHVPREAAENFHYGILVRDLSRQAEALGTEIPVVRERDLRTSEFFMLNVPIDPRSRQTLRVYALGVSVALAELDITPMSGSGRNIHDSIGLTAANDCTVHACTSDVPAYTAIELSSRYPELLGGGPYRVRLVVTSSTGFVPAWGFVSVTNNTTQHVTVVTPQ